MIPQPTALVSEKDSIIATPKFHRTKIVCTLGPASRSLETVRAMMEAGGNVFRINLSHGDYATHADSIACVRRAARELNYNAALLLDLQGVKVRTTPCRSGPFAISRGASIEIQGGHEPSDTNRIYIAPPTALQGLCPQDRVLMDDGRLSLRAIRRKGDAWECLVETDGIVKDKKGVNLPDTPTRELTELTAKDIADIEWGVQNGVDFFALSFVRSSQDVVSAKQVIQGLGADTPLIAKIEKPEALSDLEGILQESFGVMVARGDLGVEAPPEKVPVMQKKIIAEARRLRKPVITATQMLESMITRPFPSRAEASDIANAVFDGTDAVMLSGETSVGKYPVESVLMMERITAEAEAALLSQRRPRPLSPRKVNFTNAVGTAACVAAESIRARCIIVYTHGGYSAALVSGCRPSMPIFTFGDSEKILRRLALIWGIEARCLPLPPDSVEDLVKTCEKHLMDARLVEPKDSVVVVGGIPFRERGNTNFLKTHRIGESG